MVLPFDYKLNESEARSKIESIVKEIKDDSVIITDKDGIVSVVGASKKEYLEKKISDSLEDNINQRKIYSMDDSDKALPMYEDEDVSELKAQIIAPIIAEGDVIGSVIIASKDESSKFGEVEKKIAETAAAFLGKQMEQ